MKVTKSRAFMVGAAVGAGLCASVLLLDSRFTTWTFNPPPPTIWQQVEKVILYPGLLAGGAFYGCCSEWFADSQRAENVAVTVGTLTVAGFYGLVAVGLVALAGRRHPGPIAKL